MRIADESWTPCSVDRMALSFLRSEQDEWTQITSAWDRRLIGDAADVSNVSDNQTRAAMLRAIRGPLLRQVPAETDWFEVHHLRREHLGEIHAIYREDWMSFQDHNEIEKVAQRKRISWDNSKIFRCEPILFGHSKNGPFTVLEGNKRMAALVNESHFQLTAVIGLSRHLCSWHMPDWLPSRL